MFQKTARRRKGSDLPVAAAKAAKPATQAPRALCSIPNILNTTTTIRPTQTLVSSYCMYQYVCMYVCMYVLCNWGILQLLVIGDNSDNRDDGGDNGDDDDDNERR
jgi:hypothetical protein